MAKNVMRLKLLFLMVSLAAITGCSGDKDELADVKAQLARTQKELERMEGKYNALAEDWKNAKTARRHLEDQFDELDSAYSDTEKAQKTLAERYASQLEYITALEEEVIRQQEIIDRQDILIAEQEADLAEFLNMMGLSTNGELPPDY